MSRSQRAKLAQETLKILEAGRYEVGGQWIDITQSLAFCRANTVSYPPDKEVPCKSVVAGPTTVEVTHETTLAACNRLIQDGCRVVALNFASAKNPGGGFLLGAQAQEESLARSSGLYISIAGNSMYRYHRARRDALYTDYAIYSPDVPVFRDDCGELLATPYNCSFITAPAANAGVVLAKNPEREDEVCQVMRRRTARVLSIGLCHDHDAIVLGAWGCGVFGNKPHQIARFFVEALATTHAGRYRRVVFAVLDSSPERHFIAPFEAAVSAMTDAGLYKLNDKGIDTSLRCKHCKHLYEDGMCGPHKGIKGANNLACKDYEQKKDKT